MGSNDVNDLIERLANQLVQFRLANGNGNDCIWDWPDFGNGDELDWLNQRPHERNQIFPSHYDHNSYQTSDHQKHLSSEKLHCGLLSDEDMAAWREALKPPTPPSWYICRICHQPGHYITYCDKAPPRHQFLTPYQGPKRCFGLFQCGKCHREWTSCNSWAERGQSCRICKRLIYPNKQFPFDQIPAKHQVKYNLYRSASEGSNWEIMTWD